MNLTMRAMRPALACFVMCAGVVAYQGQTVRAAPALQVVAVVGGQPDDIAVDAQGRLIWGDLTRGSILHLVGRQVVTVARGLSVPEGIVALPNGNLLVAEQGYDRIDRIGRGGARTVIYALQPVAGQEGVDGIGRDPRTGDLLVPDSPRGTLLRMSTNGRNARLVAGGIGRPVDAAVDRAGDVLLPDEHLGTVVVVSPRGRVSYRGSLPTPDDVAVGRSGRIWVTTLGDGGLWVIDGSSAPRRVLSGLAYPQGLTLDRCGDPVIVEQSSARIVRLLLTSASSRCAF
jgi:sugar lactone lactonase YvrE